MSHNDLFNYFNFMVYSKLKKHNFKHQYCRAVLYNNLNKKKQNKK